MSDVKKVTEPVDFKAMWAKEDAKAQAKTAPPTVVLVAEKDMATASVAPVLTPPEEKKTAPAPVAPAVEMALTPNKLFVPRVYMDGEKIEVFSYLIIIEAMANKGIQITISGEGLSGSTDLRLGNPDDRVLDPLLQAMFGKGLIEMRPKENIWAYTQKGLDFLKSFMTRFSNNIGVWDVFEFVDIVNVEFAYSSFFNCSEEAWIELTNRQVVEEDGLRKQFRDLRITVIEHLNSRKTEKIDLVELVFMDMLIRGTVVQVGESGWQDELYLSSWKDLIKIVSSYPSPEEIPGIDRMIQEGFKVMVWMKQEDEKNRLAAEAQEGANAELARAEAARQVALNPPRQTVTTVVEEVVEEVEYVEMLVPVVYPPITYYNHYAYDPYFEPPMVGINIGCVTLMF